MRPRAKSGPGDLICNFWRYRCALAGRGAALIRRRNTWQADSIAAEHARTGVFGFPLAAVVTAAVTSTPDGLVHVPPLPVHRRRCLPYLWAKHNGIRVASRLLLRKGRGRVRLAPLQGAPNEAPKVPHSPRARHCQRSWSTRCFSTPPSYSPRPAVEHAIEAGRRNRA